MLSWLRPDNKQEELTTAPTRPALTWLTQGGSNSKEEKKKRQQTTASKILSEHPVMQDIKHPCRTLIVGKSQSGKTTLAMDVIQVLIPQVDEVWICSPTYRHQPTYKPIREQVTIYHQSLIVILRTLKKIMIHAVANDKHVEGEKVEVKRLLVLDDVSYEKDLNTGSKGILNSLFYNAVWWNMSLVVICHGVVNVGKGIRENLEHLILFQTVVGAEKEAIYETWGGYFADTKKEFMKFFKQEITLKVKENPEERPFIYVNLRTGKVYYKFKEELQIN